MHGGRLARGEHRAGGLEARVGEARGPPGSDRPGHQPAVEAVDHRGQVAPRAGRQPELRDVGDPQLVGSRGPEMVGAVGVERQGRGRRRSLAGVAAPPPAAPPPSREPHLAHQPAHDLLAHAGPAGAVVVPGDAGISRKRVIVDVGRPVDRLNLSPSSHPLCIGVERGCEPLLLGHPTPP